MSKQGNKYISASDISFFCAQVALILKAAIPIEEGIAAIHENIENPKAKALVKSIEVNINKYGSFYVALKETNAFPPYLLNMVNIGEKAGKLDDIMEALSQYYNRESKLKAQIFSAILYPFILILMMSAVVAVLSTNVLPIFKQVFSTLGESLDSSAAMTIGMAIGKYSFIVVFALAIIFLIGYILYFIPGTTKFFSRLAQNSPIIGKITAKIDSARFASVLSMLLSSGYDTSEALDLLPSIMNNDNIINKIELCKADINAGKPFAEAISEAQIFTGVYSSMIYIGAKTGNLDSVMRNIADNYSDEVDISISNTISVIEPTIVAVLSVIIGAILISIMLPLMGIMSSIG